MFSYIGLLSFGNHVLNRTKRREFKFQVLDNDFTLRSDLGL